MDNNKAQESWNMATETLKRLSRCLDLCSFASQHDMILEWLDASRDLRRNIVPFLEADEIEKLNKILQNMPLGWKNSEGKVIRQHYQKVYKVLDEFYIECVTLMKAKGLLMPKTSDPRAAVLNN